jgi:peptidyl-prolyl cis-trans isomerase D
MFEQRMREQLVLSPVQEPISAANIVARSAAARYLALFEQQREVAVASVDAAPLAKDVAIDDAQVKTFYDQNQGGFQTPEQAKIEYVLLTLPALAAKTAVEPAEVRKHYDDNLKNYSKPEERRASHILVALTPDAKPDDRAAAKKKAETLLAQARANPAKFADLAKANSEDQGSAQQGGDLGSFARGSMVKAFEDAAFAAKPGDIVGPVETEFGYHVIRVTGVDPGRTRAFEEVKAELEQDLKRQKAQARFAQAADQLQNLVYEQADSLAPAAKALDVEVTSTPFISRAQVQQLAMNNAKFVEALFSPESLQGKRNTDAIEIGQNALIAGRIVEYKPAAARPFEEVKDEIRRQLVARAAAELAQKAGREKLAALEQGKSDKEAGLAFGKPVTLKRYQPQPGFSPDAITKVFQADANRLPALVGAANERGGFSIYRVTAVRTPSIEDDKAIQAASERLGEQLGRELGNAYIAALKAGANVTINSDALQKK